MPDTLEHPVPVESPSIGPVDCPDADLSNRTIVLSLDSPILSPLHPAIPISGGPGVASKKDSRSHHSPSAASAESRTTAASSREALRLEVESTQAHDSVTPRFHSKTSPSRSAVIESYYEVAASLRRQIGPYPESDAHPPPPTGPGKSLRESDGGQPPSRPLQRKKHIGDRSSRRHVSAPGENGGKRDRFGATGSRVQLVQPHHHYQCYQRSLRSAVIEPGHSPPQPSKSAGPIRGILATPAARSECSTTPRKNTTFADEAKTDSDPHARSRPLASVHVVESFKAHNRNAPVMSRLKPFDATAATDDRLKCIPCSVQ